MSEVKFKIEVDGDNKTITIIDDGTDYSGLSSINLINIYFRGEDKTKYIKKLSINDSANISAFLNESVGLVYTFESIFGSEFPPDNFYQLEIVVNEGEADQMLSQRLAFGSTYRIEEVVHRGTLSLHVPINDLYTSLHYGMNAQLLEYMEKLSTVAVYSYDREVKWRKAYNHIYNTTNDFDY